MKRVSGVVAWVAIAFFLTCSYSPKRLNVLLIGIDTLRPDHLSCYGYNQATSPNTDNLAREGVLFENVLSSSPWTLPSFATVLTSLYASQHGANGFGAKMKTTFPSLPMMLLKKGYSTAAIINAPYLYPGCGMSRGFEFYDVMPGGMDREAPATTKEALKWLDSNSGRPFFMFVHYFDPHYPYTPPKAYRARFGPAEPGPGGPLPDRHFDAELLMEFRGNPSVDLAKVTEQQWAYVKGLYDGEIAFTDKAVGDLLQGLKDRGLREKTVIILLSDHGEEFGDHGGFEHGHTLFNELLRVPLIVSLPGVIPQNMRIARQVRLLDITPTVLDFLGYKPTTHVEGVSLKPVMEGEPDVKPYNGELLPANVAYASAVLYGPKKNCVTAFPWKLIREVNSGKEELFNLAADPAEAHDMASERPDALKALHEVLVKTVLGISETWYVRIQDGGAETFDVGISLGKGLIGSGIYLHEFLDEKGNIIEKNPAEDISVSTTSIKIDNLQIDGSLTLAFKVGPGIVPLEFDLEINGKDATDRTFLGETLATPARMPFTERGERAGQRSLGVPKNEPAGPCYLVWHSGSTPGDTSKVEFDQETTRVLKALGYLQ